MDAAQTKEFTSLERSTEPKASPPYGHMGRRVKDGKTHEWKSTESKHRDVPQQSPQIMRCQQRCLGGTPDGASNKEASK